MIRNKPVEKALADLTFSKKRISDDVKKTLQSAIANAENNHGLDVDELVVAEAFVGKNMVLKRGQPARARPLRQDPEAVQPGDDQGSAGGSRGDRLMGQKINPIGLRLQVNRTWDSRWFADGAEYGKLLHEDLAIREFIKKNAAQAGISRVVIERPHQQVPGDDPRRPSGRHHRQEGRRHRGAAQEAGAVHQVGAAPQHRRGPQARDRRRAGRREHRPAARAAGLASAAR